MPLSYTIKQSVLIYTSVGTVDFESGMAVFAAGLNAYEKEPIIKRRVIFDLRCSGENRSEQELISIANLLKNRFPGIKTALLVKSDLLFGLSRLFSVYVDTTAETILVSRDPEESCHWLGSPTLADELDAQAADG